MRPRAAAWHRVADVGPLDDLADVTQRLGVAEQLAQIARAAPQFPPDPPPPAGRRTPLSGPGSAGGSAGRPGAARRDTSPAGRPAPGPDPPRRGPSRG